MTPGLQITLILIVATLVPFLLYAFVRGSIWFGNRMQFQEFERRHPVVFPGTVGGMYLTDRLTVVAGRGMEQRSE